MGIDCMGMGGNGNVKSHSRTSLVGTLKHFRHLPSVVVTVAQSLASAYERVQSFAINCHTEAGPSRGTVQQHDICRPNVIRRKKF